ncbi:CYTH and CHAD domain-containing protein [Streptomyces vietnamensis]|uniref:Metal-binding protein n=1 Tax=Streptomyces vietnamensis TaxID=362257 RepID=A0A0B5IA74_9ACTN|nr:CYTH and CHAD domain-containing protein [Streptomyces vietnamensis]AJF65184.1 metal-binding protein [Streptomyces vietnamensis]
MAETKREIERKYEATGDTGLPDLTRVPGVSSVVDDGVMELDAVYHDTPDLRLAADGVTLRRRTGGSDAGWHIKFPVAAGIRDEIRAPLSDTLPDELAGLLRSRVRDAEIVPAVHLRSSRDVRHLLDADGTLLAELSVDTVHAERLPGGAEAAWTEIEVELADDADPAILDAIEERLGKAGIVPSEAPSKLARALTETGSEPPATPTPGGGTPEKPGTAGAAVLAYVREQAEAIVALDPAVRRDLPDAVHQLRVACRRLRSAFKTYRAVLDRDVTDPLGEELKWLAGELGVARDQEVLAERLRTALGEVPETLRLGPVAARLQIWTAARGEGARHRALDALDSARHRALLDALDALLADPPLRRAASRKARKVLTRAVLKDHDRLAARVDRALALDPGHDRDLALHEARKAAKRARYAAEAARPTLGKPAKKLAKRVKAVQSLLGEHQDGVVARETLRELAVQAHAAGESAFTWGLLHGREEAAAMDQERELPGVWARASAPKIRAALTR